MDESSVEFLCRKAGKEGAVAAEHGALDLSLGVESVPLISVIIVTWNAKHYTRLCLRSLKESTTTPIMEVIVVDNASSDGTAQMVAEEFSGVILIRNTKNTGFARANNIGIAMSRGKYVCLVNSDVVVPDGCLGKMLAYMQENVRVGVLGPRMLGPDGTVRRSCMRFPTLWRCLCRALGLDGAFKGSRLFAGYLMRRLQWDHTLTVEVLNGWYLMVRRAALEKVGPLDEGFFMYGEDIDWCYRFQQAGWQAVYFADAEAIHFGGASSAQAPLRFYIEMHRANIQLWQKHHGGVSLVAYWLILCIHHVARVLGYGAIYALKPRKRPEADLKMRRSGVCLGWLIGIWDRAR